MKAVLVSLKPYYYYLVGEGIKKIEVRKGMPKAEDWNRDTFFYMSKDEKSFAKIPKEFQEKYRKHFGKVGLQFVCGRIDKIGWFSSPNKVDWKDNYNEETCLTNGETYEYTKGNIFYEWHISNLEIYDTPKELSEFKRFCDGGKKGCDDCDYYYLENSESGRYEECCCDNLRPLKRPFESWGYVEVEQ